VATNDFLAFAVDSGANVVTQDDYISKPEVIEGFTVGVLQSALANKVWRQSSFISAAIAQFVFLQTGQDVLDNGDLAYFVSLFADSVAALGEGSGGGGVGGLSRVAIGDTPPPVPLTGQLWLDTTSVQLYVWYDDGNSAQWCVCNTAPINAPPATPSKYSIGFSYVGGVLGASQLLGMHPIARAIVIPANFGTVLGYASKAGGSANATASTVVTVARALAANRNSFTQIGTITFAAGTITPTFATTGGAPVNCAADDVLRVVGPTVPDTSFANFYATLVAQEA
jgi:hypothetical protein